MFFKPSGILGTLLGLYFLALLVNFVLKLIFKDEQPAWMKVLDQICAPGVEIGKIIKNMIFKDKEFSFDMNLLMGAAAVAVTSSVVCTILGILHL